MSDDLLSLVTGGQQSFAPAPAPATPKPARAAKPTFADDTDAMVRTIYGEADPAGRQAVAAVIRNRATASGKGIADVVTEPGQFEAWQRPEHAARMMALKADSPEYRQIAAEIAPVLAGKVDPTGGADSYYAPKLQSDLGRNKPAWDDGTGQQIGSQLYFKGKYGGASGGNQGGDDLLSMVTGGKSSFGSADIAQQAPQQPAADAARVSNEFVVQGNGAPNSSMSPAQLKTYQQMAAAGIIDIKKGAGTVSGGEIGMPYAQTKEQEDAGIVPEGPGVYYTEYSTGKLKQTPGKPVGKMEGLERGAAQGVRDVYGSVVNLEKQVAKVNPLLGYAADADVNPFLKYSPLISQEMKDRSGGYGGLLAAQSENDLADRNVYNARYGANGYATGGRIAGNIAASAPLMAGGGAVLDAAGASLGPAGTFIAGQAGRGGSGAANALLRGSSLAARGGVEGAEAAGLTSSASDAPIQNQLTEGAVLGGVLAPVAPVIGAGFKSAGKLGGALLDPITETGQNKIVNRFLQERAAGAPVALDAVSPIPGVQRTTAQSVVGGNSGLSALERSTKATNTEFSNQFDALMKSNNEARKTYLSDIAGTKDDLALLTQQRDAAATPLRETAFVNAKPADPQPVIAEIDKILQSPAGQSDAVQDALSSIKKKLVKADADGKVNLQTDPEQLYGIRKAIDTSLSPLAVGTTADKRLATAELMQVKSALDDAIEQAAPGFGSYLAKYAELSKPVNEAQYLQSLNLVDTNGHMTLGKVDSALKAIEKLRSKSGVNPAKSISDDTLEKLRALRDDLQAEAQSNAGRGAGSDTAQKLATAGMTKALGASKFATNALGVAAGLGGMASGHGPVESMGAGAGIKLLGDVANNFYGAKNAEIQNKLIAALLDPKNANLNGGGVSLGGLPKLPLSQINKLTGVVKKQAVPAGVILGRNSGLIGNTP